MVELRPETDGHVVNAAQGGAPAAALEAQGTYALQYVPAPQLVIIAVDADDLCPPPPDDFKQFGDSLTEVLNMIVAASPESRILMLSKLGRPSRAELEEFLAAHPEVPELDPMMSGSGPCAVLDTDFEPVQAKIDHLNEVYDAQDAEKQRRCDAVPQCQTDDGAHAAYVDEVENLSSDLNHLNVRGQAQVAELTWPVVAEVLQVDASIDQSVSSTDPD
jgi:hypothetical protein